MAITDIDVDVLIAGAGPAGLMMACQLAMHNISFRIIDKKASPEIHSGALIVHAPTLEILQQMGIAEKAIARGIIAKSINIRFNRNISTIDISNAGNSLTRFPFLLMIEQWQTENLLIEFLKERGHVVENKTELLTFLQESDSVTSEIRNRGGGTGLIKSRFLIGADGKNSIVRKQLNISFPGKTHQARLFITDCEARTPIAKNEILFSFTAEYTAGFFPLPGNRCRVDGMIPKIQKKENVSFGDVKDFFAANSGSGIELQNPQWFSVFRSHSRCAASFRQNQCFLVGDAAHVHSPVGAQGMNTGIQDSHNLAWKLAFFIRANASVDLLDTYEEERRPLALNIIRYTDFAYSLLTGKTFPARLLRLKVIPLFMPLLLKRLKKNEGTRTHIFNSVSGIGARYGSNLPQDLSNVNFPAHAPKPGERLPCLGYEASGKPFSLYNNLDSLTFHLFVFGKSALPDVFQSVMDERSEIISVKYIPHESGTQHLFESLGIKHAGCYLVRPDLFIAWRSIDFNETDFTHYLQKTLK